MALMISQPKIDLESPVVATAWFDPPSVRPGEESTYRISMNALEESVEMPAKMPALQNTGTNSALGTAPAGGAGGTPALLLGARGQMLQFTGSSLQPRTMYNFHVYPLAVGRFTLPEFKIMVYGKPVTIPAAYLDVLSNPPASQQASPRLIVELPNTNLFAGQAVQVRVHCPLIPAGPVMALNQVVQLTGDGFIIDQSTVRQSTRVEPRLDGAGNLSLFIYEAVFTPITTGKVSFMAQAFAIVNHAVPVPGAAIDRYGGPGAALAPRSFSNQQLLLDSEPFEVEVQPLPSKGQLPGFTGAIGSLALGPVSVSTNEAQVGETLKLTVKVFGDTNTSLNRLVAPPPLRVPEWQMFPAVSDNLPPQPPGSMAPGPDKSSFVSFNYTLIPLSEKATNTPAIPFSYFDMHRNAYADITIPSVPLIVHPGASPADLQALLQPASSDTNTEKEPVLSGLATSPGLASGSLVPIQRQFWFPLMQILPAAGFVGLWTWERRRRYLEQHPEVILRRRARRAMRRQWRLARRAAAARDSGRFAAAAVNAMRAACAPHYPAEAGALVGSDVLGVLAERDRVGHVGDVIRRFFATTDACSFATNPPETSQLLGLRADLESLLEKLEEKL